MLRVERKPRLCHLQREQEKETDRIEDQQRRRVTFPVGFDFGFDSRNAVNELFNRPEQRREPGALTVERLF